MNSTTTHSRSRHQAAAFTLVDLLAIIGVLAVGFALLTPTLARTQPNSKTFQCLNNHRQLCRAWLMYADDNRDWLLDARSWMYGDVSPGGGTEQTNVSYLKASRLSPYLGGNYEAYKCPSDPRTYLGKPVVRSVSMNCYIGKDLWDPIYLSYTKLSSMTRPGPATTLVILDESSLSINDGLFAVNMSGYDPYRPSALAFVSVPGSFHNNAGSLSFADGHAEIHRWRDPRTAKAVLFTSSPNNADVAWLQERSTRKLNNPTR
jgi:prepilin-type processing-associated H-X9-DG protein